MLALASCASVVNTGGPRPESRTTIAFCQMAREDIFIWRRRWTAGSCRGKTPSDSISILKMSMPWPPSFTTNFEADEDQKISHGGPTNWPFQIRTKRSFALVGRPV